MIRFLIPLLLVLPACTLTAPDKIVIPANAPQVSQTPDARLQARVAISYRYIRDSLVVNQSLVSEGWGGKPNRRVTAVYHIAPASRAVLTKAFERVFTDVEVFSGDVNPGNYDFVIVPKVQVFDMHKTFHDADHQKVNITYRIYFRDSRGKPFQIVIADGYGRLPDNSRHSDSSKERATIAAMESAANSIVRTVPDIKAMAPWRSQ